MRILTLFVTLAFLAFGGHSLAQDDIELKPNRADIVRLLGQVPDFAPIREELTALGFEGENLELAVAHAELVYRDPVLAGHVADQVIAAFLDPETVAIAGGAYLAPRGTGFGASEYA